MKRILSLLAIGLMVSGSVLGQRGGNQQNYTTTYQNITIAHKRPYYYDKASTNGDTPGKNNPMSESGMIKVNGHLMQNTSTYYEDVYVYPTSNTVTLALPFTKGGSVSNSTYERVYDYTTDGKFTDLTMNTTGYSLYKNGYVFGSKTVTGRDDDNPISSFTIGNITQDKLKKNTYQIAVDASKFEDWVKGSETSVITREYLDEEHKNDNSGYEWDAHYQLSWGYRQLRSGHSINDGCYWQNSPTWYGANFGRWYKEVTTTKRVDFQEPTLVSRAVFTLHPASEMADSLKAVTERGEYLQDKKIKFPSVWLGLNESDDKPSISNELKAQNYFCYEGSSVEQREVKVELRKGSSGITLQTNSLGNNTARFIYFNYPSGKKVTDVSVPDTILVTTTANQYWDSSAGQYGETKPAKTYNIARFIIEFEDDAEPRPWKDILVDSASAKRSPIYMDEHYTKVTSLDFDYTPKRTWVNPAYSDNYTDGYLYPLAFEDMQFGFCGGTYGSGGTYTQGAQWGQYSIEKTHTSYASDTNMKDISQLYYDYFSKHGTEAQKALYASDSKKDGGYYIYIDASDFPSQVGTLRFASDLCMGTRLHLSAWVSALDYTNKDDGGNLLFTLVGIDENGNETELENFSTGVFRASAKAYNGTTYGSSSNGDSKGYGDYVSGTGVTAAKYIWQQIKFTAYISPEYNGKFVACAIKVYNNCRSTTGGDMFIDDISIYVEKPRPEVKQTTPACGKTSKVMVSAEFENILNITDMKEAKTEKSSKRGSLLYCFLDKATYDSMESSDGVEKAFSAALLGDPTEDNRMTGAYHHMGFESFYTKNTKFDENTWDSSLEEKTAFYLTENGTKYLIFNACISDTKLKPNHKYYMVVTVYDKDTQGVTGIDYATFDMTNTRCRMMSEFTVQPSKRVKYDGAIDASGNGGEYCAGQTATLKVELMGKTTASPSKEVAITHVYYDWYIGSLADYNEQKYGEDGAKFSLREAVEAFRSHYTKATSAENVNADESSDGDKIAFTEAMRKAIIDASTVKPKEEQAQLTLYKQSFDFRVVAGNDTLRKVVVVPIKDPVGNDTLVYCWDPDELDVIYKGAAPTAVDGFISMEKDYDTYMQNAGIRMGLVQFANIRMKNNDKEDSSFGDNSLFIPLRNVTLTDESQRLSKPSSGEIRLTETDDPTLKVYVGNNIDNEELHVVGQVKTAGYTKGSSSTNGYEAYLQVQFYNDFQPVEGRYYRLKIPFGQKKAEGDTENTGCDGDIVVPIYIVPRYAVWVGKDNNSTEWTNDNNWRRADLSEVDYNGNYYKDTQKYTDNESNGTSKGFVPMSFTDVLLQTQSDNAVHPALYYVANNKSEQNLLKGYSADGSNTLSENATEYIQYNLEVEEYKAGTYTTLLNNHTISAGDYFCRPFYTNTCDSINFAPAAQLKGTRLLTYNAASVEYELTSNRWYTLTSPLKGVVAGDMYLPTSGRQTTSYFRPINYDANSYTRTAPAVYQKGWDKATANVYYVSKDGNIYDINNTKPSLDNKWNVSYVKADWSEEYNDVSVPYTTASPFSIMIYDGKMTSTKPEKFLLRLPKADTQYSYYTMGGTAGNEQAVTKDNVGKLITDDMTENVTATDLSVTLQNADASNDYFLVGNPFMTGLDMTEFFKQNTGLEQKYWIVNDSKHIPARWSEYTDWKTADNTVISSPGTVAPLQSFFVKRSSDATDKSANLTVKFTDDMSTIADKDAVVVKARGTRASAAASLTITAERDGLSSTALVMVNDQASNGFVDSEDAETIMDSNLGSTPTVYTTADGNAVSINTRASIDGVSLGVASGEDAEVTLTFNGVENFDDLYLYDAATKESTKLQSGASFTVAGNTAGRYYLTRGTTNIDSDDIASGYVVYSLDKTIYVKGLQGGESVKVYDAAGRMQYNTASASGDITVHVGTGVYIVKVNGTSTKLAVR